MVCNFEQTIIASVGMLLVSSLRGKAVQTYVPESFDSGTFSFTWIRGQ